jgi:hypothetical protein
VISACSRLLSVSNSKRASHRVVFVLFSHLILLSHYTSCPRSFNLWFHFLDYTTAIVFKSLCVSLHRTLEQWFDFLETPSG